MTDPNAARRERRRSGQSAVRLPEVVAADPEQFLTLGELRDLVEAADALTLPDDVIVRGEAIPFRMADLGHVGGSVLRRVGLDRRPAK